MIIPLRLKKYLLLFSSLLYFFGCIPLIKVHKVTSSHKTILSDSIAPYSPLESLIVPYRNELKKKLSDTLIYNHTTLTKSGDNTGLGKLVAHAMKYAADSVFAKENYMIWINRGGLRTDLPSGYLTVHHIFELMPFDNTICMKEISKEEWNQNLEILENNNFIVFHNRILSRYELRKDTPPAAKVILSDFLVGGGDGIKFRTGQTECSSWFIRDIIINYLQKIKKEKKELYIDSL